MCDLHGLSAMLRFRRVGVAVENCKQGKGESALNAYGMLPRWLCETELRMTRSSKFVAAVFVVFGDCSIAVVAQVTDQKLANNMASFD